MPSGDRRRRSPPPPDSDADSRIWRYPCAESGVRKIPVMANTCAPVHWKVTVSSWLRRKMGGNPARAVNSCGPSERSEGERRGERKREKEREKEGERKRKREKENTYREKNEKERGELLASRTELLSLVATTVCDVTRASRV